VCGCTRLGFPGCSPYQEYFLLDAEVTIPVPKNLSLVQACTVGVAAETAALGIFAHLNVPIPNPKSLPSPKDEWALVIGGASSVGRMAVQIFKLAGYRVIATASPSSSEVVKSIGADEVVSYKQSEADVISEIVKKTGGKLYRAYDVVAQNLKLAEPLFKAVGGKEEKWFTSTNDWEPLPKSELYNFTAVSFGPVGRPDAKELNAAINSYIPFLYTMLESGKIKTQEYVIAGKGIESIPEAYAFQTAGKGGNKKVVVNVSDF